MNDRPNATQEGTRFYIAIVVASETQAVVGLWVRCVKKQPKCDHKWDRVGILSKNIHSSIQAGEIFRLCVCVCMKQVKKTHLTECESFIVRLNKM